MTRYLLAALVAAVFCVACTSQASAERAPESGALTVIGSPEDRIKELEDRVKKLEDENKKLKERLDKLEKKMANVDPGEPTKKLEEALERIDVSDAEKQKVREAIIECKKATLEILETPTDDKRVPAEEIIDAFIKAMDTKKEADNQKAFALFMEFGAKPLPGDAKKRTYGVAIEDAKKVLREKIGKILSAGDQRILTNAHADWSDFELAEGDPWGELYLERLEKYQKGK